MNLGKKPNLEKKKLPQMPLKIKNSTTLTSDAIIRPSVVDPAINESTDVLLDSSMQTPSDSLNLHGHTPASLPRSMRLDLAGINKRSSNIATSSIGSSGTRLMSLVQSSNDQTEVLEDESKRISQFTKLKPQQKLSIRQRMPSIRKTFDVRDFGVPIAEVHETDQNDEEDAYGLEGQYKKVKETEDKSHANLLHDPLSKNSVKTLSRQGEKNNEPGSHLSTSRAKGNLSSRSKLIMNNFNMESSNRFQYSGKLLSSPNDKKIETEAPLKLLGNLFKRANLVSFETNDNSIQSWLVFRKLSQLLESRCMTYTSSVIIVISIFGDVVRRLAFRKLYDMAMDVPLLVIMGIFVIELIFNAISRKSSYVCTVDIWLDFLATLSILIDLALFFEPVMAPYQK